VPFPLSIQQKLSPASERRPPTTIRVGLLFQKGETLCLINDPSGSQTLERACQFANAAILRVYDQMNMIRHQYVGYEFEGPFFLELGTDLDEGMTARFLLEDRKAASDITGQEM